MKKPLRKKIRMFLLLASLLAFPVTIFYFSPITPFFGLSSGTIAGSLLVFAGLFVSSLVFGRVFCGWFCPAGACQEFAFNTNGRRVAVKKIRWIKFAIWIPWLAGIVFFIIRAQGALETDFFFSTEKGISAVDPVTYIVYFSVLAVFVVLAVTVGRRAACHTICWMAPFMILGRKLGNLLHLPGLRLAADGKNCAACDSCTQACPMSLPVRDMVESGRLENSDCILCGNCTAACAKRVIRFTFSRPRAGQGEKT